jgi:fumarate reductase flavoprotein subunit
MIDIRSGELVFVQAQAVLLATGGGPTMYKYHTPSGDKSCDGMAMALRAGLTLRDMEMVQFHPTGLVAGAGTRITGTIIEEGLRGVGGYLLNGQGERFMGQYDPRNERATRDIVSRGMYDQMLKGNVGPNGGVYITMRHLDPAMVKKEFPGMVERCADCGFDLVSGLVEVVPTAHYMMGGVVFRTDCSTDLPGLFAAGEDTGGVHGANRLGGNGVANSTVYGGIAGDTMGAWVASNGVFHEPDEGAIEAGAARVTRPFDAGARGPATGLSDIRTRLHDLMWDDVGIFRDAASLARASGGLEELDARLDATGVADGQRAFNLTWHDWINLKNLVLVSQAIRGAAEQREDSRGAHYRNDHPDVRDLENSRYTTVRIDGARFDYGTRPVVFNRVRPGQSLIA